MADTTPTVQGLMDMAEQSVKLNEDLLKKNMILMTGYHKIGALLLSPRDISKDEINNIVVETLEKIYPHEQNTNNPGLVES